MKQLLSLVLIFGYICLSQTPQTLNYQGYLADSNGDPVNGSENITFRIYNVSTGGAALWTEARTVTINDGVFSVVLGENTPINLPFDTQYWLGITVGGSELSPRTKLASSAYASNLPKVAYLREEKTNGSQAGGFLNGAWRARNLNVLEGNTDFISLNSNQITLEAGTYLIEAYAPAYRVDRHQARFRNITDNTSDLVGSSEYSDSNSPMTQSKSMIFGVITISTQKIFEIQQQIETTKSFDGAGIASNFGENEVYTQVKITKIAN